MSMLRKARGSTLQKFKWSQSSISRYHRLNLEKNFVCRNYHHHQERKVLNATLATSRRWFQNSSSSSSSPSSSSSSNSTNFTAHNGGGAMIFLLTSLLGMSIASTSKQHHSDTSPNNLTLLEAPRHNYEDENENGDDADETTTVINWSGTHSIEVPNKHYFEPETISELESIVAKCHEEGIPIRPVGSALSPNAISFQPEGMVSMANLDQIVKIDVDAMTVTVQAGARVSQVIDALRPYGLTLPNLASIAEQQMGGFTQIGAHGTGANIAPVDEFVSSIKMVTPARGTVELSSSASASASDDGENEMFHLAKVGLGCMGIVSEVTMKCIPSHNLLEHTYVLTRAQARENLNELLKKHKHIRYMWIPYQDAVVVVTNDPEDENSAKIVEESLKNKISDEEKSKALKDLLKELSRGTGNPVTDEMLADRGFGELRDALLSFNPLSGEHVKTVNMAEAEFWKQSEGYQIKPSDQLLQFDCGGQQWVFEVCFPTGTYENNNGNDLNFMEDLMKKIESESIPAHAPIEQRWSASSSSLMSPAHGPKDGLHCWVGIIMYLPSDDQNERKEITDRFRGQYCDLAREVGAPYNAVSHWGKLEMPTNGENFLKLRELMQSRYPLSKFNSARQYYDPKNLLGNDLLNTVLGRPK